MGKSIQHAYRLVTFIQTIEIGSFIYQSYLKIHHHFPSGGTIDIDFIDDIQDLFHSNFPDQFVSNNPQPFRISKDVVLRAVDLISCNMRQFTLLFDSTNAPKLSSIGRQIIVVSPDQQQGPGSSQSGNPHNQLKQRKRELFLIYVNITHIKFFSSYIILQNRYFISNKRYRFKI